jgi:arylsulfatase
MKTIARHRRDRPLAAGAEFRAGHRKHGGRTLGTWLPVRGIATVAFLAIFAALIATGCGGDDSAPRPGIILITLDTTRADHLGCYGYGRATSPGIDALAAESTLFTRAYSTSSWTLPAHASLFTGKFTSSHGARYDPQGPLRLTQAIDGPDSWKEYRARGLAAGEVTLAALLRQAGYATGAVVSGPWMKRVFGLGDGFDFYDDGGISHVNGKRAEAVTDAAIDWLVDCGEPFFLFLNYYDPHTPYMPPDEYRGTFLPDPVPEGFMESDAGQIALYDAEILYTDNHVGRLIEKLKDLGLYDDCWIILTSDHGHLLGEHGMHGHGRTLSQSEIHVPLIIKEPGANPAPSRNDTIIQLVDVPAMILDRLQVPLPEGIQGQPIPDVAHPILSEVYPLELISPMGDFRVLIDGDYKFVWNDKGYNGLFNVADDPVELNNLIGAEPQRAIAMQRALADYIRSLPPPGEARPPQEVDEETRRALEGLGYTR